MDVVYNELTNSPVLSAMMRALPEVVFIVDQDRKIRAVNDATKNLVKKKAEEIIELLPGNALNCMHSNDAKEGCGFGPKCQECILRGTYLEAVSSKKPVYNREGSVDLLIDKTPERLDILINCVPFEYKNCGCAVVTMADITEIKNLEHKRNENLERLALIGSTASSIVHDLRTPLSTVLGLTYMMSGKKDCEQNEMYGKVKVMVDRITGMTDEILEIASSDAPLRLSISKVPLDLFIKDTMTDIRMPDNIKMTYDLHYHDAIELDENKIRRVIWNLVKNAREALAVSPDPEIKIVTSEHEGFATISISDNGPGIAPEDAGEIFKLGRTFGKHNGKGFGLFGSKRIVEAHGGKLSFESAPGKGATFYIRLPLEQK